MKPLKTRNTRNKSTVKSLVRENCTGDAAAACQRGLFRMNLLIEPRSLLSKAPTLFFETQRQLFKPRGQSFFTTEFTEGHMAMEVSPSAVQFPRRLGNR
jgi:hypothetical protein